MSTLYGRIGALLFVFNSSFRTSQYRSPPDYVKYRTLIPETYSFDLSVWIKYHARPGYFLTEPFTLKDNPGPVKTGIQSRTLVSANIRS